MLKNRPIMMLLTGVFLALVLWGLVLLLQKGNADINTSPIESTDTKTVPTAIPEDIVVAPASVLSVSQSGPTFNFSGKGVLGAGLSLMSGTEVLSSVKINETGVWALNLTTDALSEPLVLTLLMVTPDGYKVRSDQSIIIAPGKQVEDDEESIPALILLTAPGGHSRVMQSPYVELPSLEGFVMEAIDYDNSGGVIFSGGSVTQGKVRVYANNNPVGESRVDITGRWSLIFGNILPLGTYDIMFELISDIGGDTLKLKLPFARMQPLFEAENSPKIVVQHLEDRIQIGRALYGGGYQFTVVYAPIALSE